MLLLLGVPWLAGLAGADLPGCYRANSSWAGSELQGAVAGVESYTACQALCRARLGCTAWTWTTQAHPRYRWFVGLSKACLSSLPLHCVLLTRVGDTTTPYPASVSGPASCTCSAPGGCRAGQGEELGAVVVAGEKECQQLCSQTRGCDLYTWYQVSLHFHCKIHWMVPARRTPSCFGCASCCPAAAPPRTRPSAAAATPARPSVGQPCPPSASCWSGTTTRRGRGRRSGCRESGAVTCPPCPAPAPSTAWRACWCAGGCTRHRAAPASPSPRQAGRKLEGL